MFVILNKSPWSENYDSLLKVLKKATERKKKVAVLCIQDACIAAATDEFCHKLAESQIKIYALKVDCEERGLTRKVSSKVKLIDYTQWVKLVMSEHQNIVSWAS